MPREAKPYPERGWYVSRPHGRYLRLCPIEQGMGEAKRLLKVELGKLEAEREEMGGRLPSQMTVTELLALFLEAVEAEKDADTFLDYQRWCTEFAKQFGGRDIRTLTRGDANDFKLRLMKSTYVRGNQPPKTYSPKTVNHAIIALKRAFNWAIETERLPVGKNPFAKLKQLPTQGRRRVATEAEYRSLLKNCSDDAFRDVLIAFRYTSARPQDVYSLRWEMVDWEAHAWILHEHKGTRTTRNPKPRIIGMNEEVERMLRERMRKFGPHGEVFLNSDGRPWTKDSLGLRMRRLRERAGVGPDARGEKFVLYTNRHTFLTAAGADPNISDFMLQEIGGHTDPRTTARYIHLAKKGVANASRRVADNLTPTDQA
jgi:integrase